MAEYIFVKLGDPLYEEVFMERFKGFIIEKDGHRVIYPIRDFIKKMHAEHNKVWNISEDES